MLEWIGGQFDPEAFDMAEVNLILNLHSPGDAGSP